MKKLTTSLMAGALAFGMGVAVQAQTQGVSDDEVLIGSVNDLSGVFAAVGVPAVAGANMRFDEANAAGGVHGRKIRFIVEDNGYQIPRAMQGYNKLLNSDKVFAMLLSLGTPMNLAGFKLMDPKGIPNINPLSAARQMLQEPLHTHFAGTASYYDQVLAGVTYLTREFGGTKICSMYIPSDFGLEIHEGTVDITKKLNLTLAAETTHKPDELDFVGALTKLREAGCNVVTLALGVRQAITVVGTAKKLGWNDVKFLNTSAGFLGVVAAVPGGVTDGLYAASGWVDLYSHADDPDVAIFMKNFKAKYDQPASGFSMLGYVGADTVIRGLEAAGRDLTHDSFIAGLESLKYHSALMDTEIEMSKTNHQGAKDIVISIVRDGGWVTLARE
ncbi:MAG: ABC transporter substrate-binding protein [Rhodobacteraceae bacterium]|nr:ABC transporter substrate-binding protein [Paracoccaceae bacterium]